MSELWVKGASPRSDRRIVIVYNVPVRKDDGGYHITLAGLASWRPKDQAFTVATPHPSLPALIPLSWLIAWTEVPS